MLKKIVVILSLLISSFVAVPIIIYIGVMILEYFRLIYFCGFSLSSKFPIILLIPFVVAFIHAQYILVGYRKLIKSTGYYQRLTFGLVYLGLFLVDFFILFLLSGFFC